MHTPILFQIIFSLANDFIFVKTNPKNLFHKIVNIPVASFFFIFLWSLNFILM